MIIAVYGASGYQAKLVLTELSRRGIQPVLVGRDAARLSQAAAMVGVPDAPQRVATMDDHDALVAGFAGCDAVINCAGPFTRAGQAVVRAAIATGCHYVDTSGEQLYLKKIHDTLAGEAERAGVTVVPAANDGCVPGDLIAALLAGQISSIEEITISHRIVGGGGFSRGSLRSLFDTIDSFEAGGLTYDDGTWSVGSAAGSRSITFPGDSEPTEMASFPLPEVVTIPRHVAVKHVMGLAEATMKARLGTPIPPEVIETLPEGPTEEGRRSQRFVYVVDAVGTGGQAARGVLRGTDTYGLTAVIAVEAARRLVADGAKSGVLTPAQAFDPSDFLDYLVPHGLETTIQ